MNTLAIIFSAFVVVSSSINYGMFIPKVATIFAAKSNENCQLPLLFKQEKYCESGVENFIDNFDKSALVTLSKKLLQVSAPDGVRIVGLLNDNQKFLMRISFLPTDIQISIVAILFKGNRECSKQYCSKPIGQMLDCYVSTEKLTVLYDAFCGKADLKKLAPEFFRLHSLDLSPSQIHVLENGLRYRAIFQQDIPSAAQAIEKLNIATHYKYRDDLNIVAQSIKIYPCKKTLVYMIGSIFKNVARSSYTDFREILAVMMVMNFYPHRFMDILFPGFFKMINMKECDQIVKGSRRLMGIILIMFSIDSFFGECGQAIRQLYRTQWSLLDFI